MNEQINNHHRRRNSIILNVFMVKQIGFLPRLTIESEHNLDVLNDLLRGGLGVYEYGEPIKVIWENTDKSKEHFS